MSIYAKGGATIEALLQAVTPGQVGTYRVSIVDTPSGATFLAPTTSGIVENPTGSGIYAWSGTAPATVGQYAIIWDAGTSSNVLGVEDLIINEQGAEPITGNLCTLLDVRLALELPTSDVTRDDLINSLITSFSRAIMREVDREFAPTTASATRRFRLGNGSLTLDLSPYDLRSASSVTLNPESANSTALTATTDYQLIPFQPQDGTYLGIKFASNLTNLHTSDTARDFGYTLVDVAGAWGFPAVPEDVRRACIVAVQSAMRRDLTELAIAGIDEPQAIAPEGPATHAIPAASRRLIAPYRRTGGLY